MGCGSGVFCLVSALLCWGIILWISPANAQIVDPYKLSGDSRPVHYDLELKIDVDEQVFSGSVDITVEVVKQTTNIEFHVDKEMVVANVGLWQNGVEMIKVIQSYNEEKEIISLLYPYITTGTYQLRMDFNSKIRDDLKGLYMSTYFDDSGNKRYIATTFMAPTYARMAFPCYDEPEYKANFTIHISHAEKYFALSNMPAEDTQTDLGDGWRTTHFLESKPTSTYLVAFIVCDFEKIENPDWPLSIYAQPAMLQDLSYALDHFNKARSALESYLGRSFQYPKLDMVAIDDFLMGAMENWGLITYLSSRILINEATDVTSRIAASKILSHEMAHQWIGNEVTHHYWNMVWITEGLATLFEDLLTDTAQPEWRMWDQFVVNTMQVAMQQDSAFNVRAMMKIYSTPSDIRAVYDFVTYKKSGSVMRMMMNVLSAPVFQQGMDIYVAENSFATATHQSLASAWQTAVDASNMNLPDIATVLDHWINVPGFPVVSITRNYDNQEVTLHQRRFIASHSTFGSEVYLNHIPLNYATLKDSNFSNTAPTLWLTEREATIELSGVESNQWVIFNKQATGYYRVNYDDDNWNMITNQLKELPLIIPPSNRAQLIDDALNLARYGQLDYKVALELVSYIKSERDFVPLTSAFVNLRELDRVARGSDLKLGSFMTDLINELYLNEINLDTVLASDDVLGRLLRVEVSNFACRFAHPVCVSRANEILIGGLSEEIPADIRPAVFCGGVKYMESNGRSPFEVLFDRHSSQSATEGLRRRNDKEINEIFAALSCISDETILRQVLDWTIAGRQGVYFDKSDTNKIFAAVASANVTGTMVALDFLDTNYATMESSYESMARVFEALSLNIVTVEMQESFNKIVQTHTTESTDENLKVIIEAARSLIAENLKWKELRVESIREYLTGGATALLLSPFALLAMILSLCKTLGS